MTSYEPRAAAYPTDDPLVPSPESGLGGWYDNFVGVIRRSWRPLLTLGAMGTLPPVLALAVLIEYERRGGRLGATIAAAVLLVAFAVLLATVAAAAAVWVTTRQAAGKPAPVRAALRFAWSRLVPLVAWTLLTAGLTVLGLCAGIVPGIYLMISCALIIPVLVYERISPIRRSFALMHSAIRRAIGRLLALWLGLTLVGSFLGCPVLIAELFIAPEHWAAWVVGELWLAVAAPPLFGLTVAGVVVTYIELRSVEVQLNTDQLLTEVSARG